MAVKTNTNEIKLSPNVPTVFTEINVLIKEKCKIQSSIGLKQKVKAVTNRRNNEIINCLKVLHLCVRVEILSSRNSGLE